MKSETLKLLHLVIHMEQQKIGKPSTNRQKQMQSVYKNFHQKANLKSFASEQKNCFTNHKDASQERTRHTASTTTHISHSALCCHSNEICAPTANLPNSAQLGSTPLPFPKLHPGPYSSVGMRRGTDSCGQYTFCLAYTSREM